MSERKELFLESGKLPLEINPAPISLGGGIGLEIEPQRKLQYPGVSSGGNYTKRTRAGDVRSSGRARQPEIGVIKYIESVCAELQPQPFADGEVLAESKCDVREMWPAQVVTAAGL